MKVISVSEAVEEQNNSVHIIEDDKIYKVYSISKVPDEDGRFIVEYFKNGLPCYKTVGKQDFLYQK